MKKLKKSFIKHAVGRLHRAVGVTTFIVEVSPPRTYPYAPEMLEVAFQNPSSRAATLLICYPQFVVPSQKV